MNEICYLCGRLIAADRSVDHIPPKQFYASSLRSTLNLSQLVTLPTHGVWVPEILAHRFRKFWPVD